MKVIHISDLHFGAHDTALQSSLIDRLKEIKPDVIVCTGDVTDRPDTSLGAEAIKFIYEAASYCQNPGPQSLIIVPGNHDYRDYGFLFRHPNPPYKKEFAKFSSEGFFKNGSKNVWVFGFDSAREGKPGGGGKITEQDLERFHHSYQMHLDADKEAFAEAFKIVAVHHHPLPVNRGYDFKAPLLTMTNAGQFLTAMLAKKVDLVLHGHEHLPAKARFWSSLGDNDHEISVLSLGTTLRRVAYPDSNWFSLITIDHSGARAEYFKSVGESWANSPDEGPCTIHSSASARQADWDKTRKSCGFHYGEVAAVIFIGEEGDAKRVVECDDLTVYEAGCERAKGHNIELPPTTGYLSCFTARGKNFTLHTEGTIPRYPLQRQATVAVRFDKDIIKSVSGSYLYQWHACNSFALDKNDWNCLNSLRPNFPVNCEFAHYVVRDPIEQLTVVVEFPEGFMPQQRPHVRIAVVDPNQDFLNWPIDSLAENELERTRSLHFYDSLRIAALRVTRPHIGRSYGIQWELPDGSQDEQDEQFSACVQEVFEDWKSGRAGVREQILKMLARVMFAAEEGLLNARETWNGSLEASLMYFDEAYTLRLLGTLEHSRIKEKHFREKQYDITLYYGDGIAGRALRSRAPRVYVKQEQDRADAPDYYVPLPTGASDEVLICLPLHAPLPSDEFRKNPGRYKARRPYGVLNLGSKHHDCPLRSYCNAEKVPQLLEFQHQLNMMMKNLFEKLNRRRNAA